MDKLILVRQLVGDYSMGLIQLAQGVLKGIRVASLGFQWASFGISECSTRVFWCFAGPGTGV